MPHSKYLNKQFTFQLEVNNFDLDSGQINYLKKKVILLDDKESIRMWLLNEIYVIPEVTYKGGKLEGLVINKVKNKETATTLMLSSVLSGSKDVVGLYF